MTQKEKRNLTEITGGELQEWTIVGGFKEVEYIGDTSITMTGGSVKYIYGASQDATLTGKTNIMISGGTVGKDVYGGGQNAKAILEGESNVKISGGSVGGSVYGGGYEGDVNGNASVYLYGGTVTGKVYGDGNQETTQITLIEGKAKSVEKAASVVSGTATVHAFGTPNATVDMSMIKAKTSPANASTEQVIILDGDLKDEALIKAYYPDDKFPEYNDREINLCYATNGSVVKNSESHVQVLKGESAPEVPAHVTVNNNYVVLNNTYTIKFDLIGGASSEPGPLRLDPVGDEYSLPDKLPVPYKEGYVFTGYYYGNDTTGHKYYDHKGAYITGSGIEWKENGIIPLNAGWEEVLDPSLTLKTNDVTVDSDDGVYYVSGGNQSNLSDDPGDKADSMLVAVPGVDGIVTTYTWKVNGMEKGDVTGSQVMLGEDKDGVNGLGLADETDEKVQIVTVTASTPYQSVSTTATVYIYYYSYTYVDDPQKTEAENAAAKAAAQAAAKDEAKGTAKNGAVKAYKDSMLNIALAEGTYFSKKTVTVSNVKEHGITVLKDGEDVTSTAGYVAETPESHSADVTLTLGTGDDSAVYTVSAYSIDGAFFESKTYVLKRVELAGPKGASAMYETNKSHTMNDKIYIKATGDNDNSVYSVSDISNLLANGDDDISVGFKNAAGAAVTDGFTYNDGAITVKGAPIGDYTVSVSLKNTNTDVYVKPIPSETPLTASYSVKARGKTTMPSMTIGKTNLLRGNQVTYTSPVTGKFDSTIAGDENAHPLLSYIFVKEGTTGYEGYNENTIFPTEDWPEFGDEKTYEFKDSGKIFVKATCDGYTESEVYYAEVLLKVIRIDQTAPNGVYQNTNDKAYEAGGTYNKVDDDDTVTLETGRYTGDDVVLKVSAYDENWYTKKYEEWTEDTIKSRFYFNWHYGASDKQMVNGASAIATEWSGTKDGKNMVATSVLKIPTTLLNDTKDPIAPKKYYFVCDVLSTTGAAPVSSQIMEVTILPIAAEPEIPQGDQYVQNGQTYYVERYVDLVTKTSETNPGANVKIYYDVKYTDLSGRESVKKNQLYSESNRPHIDTNYNPGKYEVTAFTSADNFGDSEKSSFVFYAESGTLDVTVQPGFDNGSAGLVYSVYDKDDEDFINARKLTTKAKLTLGHTSTDVTVVWVEAADKDVYDSFKGALEEDRNLRLGSYLEKNPESGLTVSSNEAFRQTQALMDNVPGEWDFTFPAGRNAGEYYFFGYAECPKKPGIRPVITDLITYQVDKRNMMDMDPIPSVSLTDLMVDGQILEPVVSDNYSGGDVQFFHKKTGETDAFYKPGACRELSSDNVGRYTLKAEIAETENYKGCSIYTEYEVLEWMYNRIEDESRYIFGDDAYAKAEAAKQDSTFEVRNESNVTGQYNISNAVVSGPPVVMTVSKNRADIEYVTSDDIYDEIKLSVENGSVKVTSTYSKISSERIRNLEGELNSMDLVDGAHLKEATEEESNAVRGAVGMGYGFDYGDVRETVSVNNVYRITARIYRFSDFERDSNGHRIPIESAFSLTKFGTATIYVLKRDESGAILYDENDVPYVEEQQYVYTEDREREEDITSLFTLEQNAKITFDETADVNGGIYRPKEGVNNTQLVNNGKLSNVTLEDGMVLSGGGTVENLKVDKDALVKNNTLAGDIVGGGVLQNVFIAEEAVVTGMVLRGKISNEGTLVNCVLEDGAVVTGGYIFKSMTSSGTLKGVSVITGGEVTGGTLIGGTVSGKVKDAVLKDIVSASTNGALEGIVIEEDATLNGGTVYGTDNVNRGSADNIVIAADSSLKGGCYGGDVDCYGTLSDPVYIRGKLTVREEGKVIFDHEGGTETGSIVNMGTLDVVKGVKADGDITNTGVLDVKADSTVTGSLINYEKCTIAKDASLTIGGRLDNTGSMENYGTVKVTGEQLSRNVSLKNAASAVLTIDGNVETLGTIDNAGTITIKKSAGAAELINNTGTLTIGKDAGKMDTVTNSGRFTVGGSCGGMDVLDNSGEISVGGDLESVKDLRNLAKGTITVEGALNAPESIDNAGTIIIKKSAGAAELINNTGTLTIEGTAGKMNVVTNSGELTVGGEIDGINTLENTGNIHVDGSIGVCSDLKNLGEIYFNGELRPENNVVNSGVITGGESAVYYNEGLTIFNDGGELNVLVENEGGTIEGGTVGENGRIEHGTFRKGLVNKGYLNDSYLILDGPFVNSGTIYHPVVDPAYDVHDIKNTGHIIFFVEFDVMGHALDQQPATQDVELDHPIKDTGILTEKNYTFMGWYQDTYAVDYWNVSTRPVIESTKLYAEWTGDGHYTLRYYANGGEDSPLDEKTYLQGEEVIVNMTNVPVREGYVFRGWAVNLDDINPTYEPGKECTFVMPAHNVVLYAVWMTAAASSIEAPEIIRHPDDLYVRQGGTCEPLTVMAEVSDGGILTYQWYRNDRPSPEGAVAVEGAIDSSYTPDTTQTGTLYYYCVVTNRHSDKPQEDAFRSSTSNFCSVSVYSVDDPSQVFTVVFDTMYDDATKVSAYKNVTKGSRITEPEMPEREGYAFRGWYKDSSVSDVNKWDFATDTVDGDITLYAGWDTKLLVTYNGNGGKITPMSSPSVYVRYGEKAPILNPDIYSVQNGNYSLTGWFKDSMCTMPWDFETDVVRKDLVLYAGWGFSAGVEDQEAEMSVAAIPDYYYTGKRICPSVTLTDKGKLLVEGTDYKVRYRNNKNVSTGAINNGLLLDGSGSIYYSQEFSKKKPMVIIEGIGNYKQTIYMNFNILPLSLGNAQTDICAKEVTADICTGYTATGRAIKPSVSLYYNGKKLKNKRDYEVVLVTMDAKEDGQPIKSGTNILKGKIGAKMTGTFLMKINGINSYCDGFEKVVTVLEGGADLSKAKVKVGKLQYTGSDLRLEDIPVTVKIGSRTLTAGTDYELAFISAYVKAGTRMEAGSYPVKIIGKGNYGGSRMFTVKVLGKSLRSADVTLSANSVDYDGTYHGDMGIKVAYKVTTDEEAELYGVAKGQKAELRKGADYKVEVTGGTNAGTATVTITGRGGFSESKSVTYKINPIDLNSEDVTLTESLGEFKYTGAPLTPDVELFYKGNRLLKNVDYTLTYSKNDAAGSTATITVKGIGNFKGSPRTKATFTIGAKETVSGNGIYDIKKAKFVIAQQVYSGEEIVITDDSQFIKASYENKALKLGVDFEVVEGSYSGNLNCVKGKVSKGRVTLRGIGDYTGTKTVKFRVVRKPVMWWIAQH